MDRLQIRRRGPPDVQSGAGRCLVALRATDGDAGGPVVTKLDIDPPDARGLRAPKHGVPHDRYERDVHQTAAAGGAGPLGPTAGACAR